MCTHLAIYYIYIHTYLRLTHRQEANLMLELVQKGLAEYLETKRVAFHLSIYRYTDTYIYT